MLKYSRITVWVIFNEIDSLFCQLNQNVPSDLIYSICKSNCFSDNFTYKTRKFNDNQVFLTKIHVHGYD